MTNLEYLQSMSAEKLGAFLAELEAEIEYANFNSHYNSTEMDLMLAAEHEKDPKPFTHWLNKEYRG